MGWNNVDWNNVSIKELSLSGRVYNSIYQTGLEYHMPSHGPIIKSVGDILRTTRYEILRIPGFGKKSLKELRVALKAIGAPDPFSRRPASITPKSDRSKLAENIKEEFVLLEKKISDIRSLINQFCEDEEVDRALSGLSPGRG